MDNRKRKGESVKGILLAGNIGKAVFVFLLLLATTFVASAVQSCDHNVEVLNVCCDDECSYKTWGWFYNETSGNWNYTDPAHPDCTVLFHLRDNTDGEEYYAYCTNYTVPLGIDTFNASIYAAEPTCKNNSRAYILNNWTHDCISDCDNISAAQSAIWYFSYIDENFCLDGTPTYNHTAKPGNPEWESNWIPNCSAHPKACDFINASINKSVPYNITIDPKTGSYVKGTPVELTATVGYCAGEGREQVTVVFGTDAGNFSENNLAVYENTTVNGIAKATLVCDAGIANVTIRVKDMKWFEIVDATGCNQEEYQETLRVINITDEANFSFSDEPQKPDIKIVKLVNGVDTYIAVHNEMVTFTLNVTNAGNATLREITVNDTLPANLTYIYNASPVQDSVDPNPDGTKTIIWKNNLTTELDPGNYFVITFNATIDMDAESGKIYRNWVTVNATSDYGDVNDSDYADVYLERHYRSQVPVLTPFGIAALIGLLSLVVVLSIRKSKGKGKRGGKG